jgi:hypothetical protein
LVGLRGFENEEDLVKVRGLRTGKNGNEIV